MMTQIKIAKISNCLIIASYMTGSSVTIDGGWLIKNGHAIPYKYNL